MTDYKRAFEICKDKLQLGVHPLVSPKRTLYMMGVCESDEEVTKEEYDCINECLNAEEDSMDKIKTDFEELGYECEFIKTDTYKCFKLKSGSKDYYDMIEIYIGDDKKPLISSISYGVWASESKIITLKELQLINRILRLCGMEV